MGFLSGIADKILGGGSSNSPGAAGTGRFTFSKTDIAEQPFKRTTTGTGTQEQLRKKQDELRKKQQEQINRSEAQARGESPSIAEAELKAATSRSLAQQLAAAKSGRGGNAAARERQLAKGQAGARRDVSEQAAIAKLKEQQLAEQNLAQQLATTQAGAQAQRAQDINISEADRASAQKLEELKLKQHIAAEGGNLSGFQSAAEQRSGMFQGVMGGISSMISGSDKNIKKGIKKEDSKLAKALSDEDCKKDKKKEDDVEIDTNIVKEKKEKKEKEGIDLKTITKVAGLALTAMSDENCKESKKKEDIEFNKQWKAGKAKQDILAKQRKQKESPMGKHFERAEKSGMEKKAAVKLWNKRQAKAGVEKAKERRAVKEESSFSKFASGYKKGSDNAKSKRSSRDSFGKSLMQSEMSEVSDKNCKKNVEDFNPKSFLDALQAYSYEYKDDFKGEDMGGNGRYLSVMAQDLEKAGPVGKSMVKIAPEGNKYVDYGKGFGAILAAQAHLNQRLSELEKKKK